MHGMPPLRLTPPASRGTCFPKELGGSAMFDQFEGSPRLTVNQWKIIVAAIIGDMLEFFDYS